MLVGAVFTPTGDGDGDVCVGGEDEEDKTLFSFRLPPLSFFDRECRYGNVANQSCVISSLCFPTQDAYYSYKSALKLDVAASRSFKK